MPVKVTRITQLALPGTTETSYMRKLVFELYNNMAAAARVPPNKFKEDTTSKVK